MSTALELQKLFGEDQLRQMKEVRQVMLDDPKVFDNHSREVRDAEGKEAAEPR